MVAILDFQSEQFKLFLIYKSPQCFLLSFESTGLSVQEKKQKIDFQDGSHGGYLGVPIKTVYANFDLQVTLMLPTKFRVSWPLGSGEEAKNRFSRWQSWQPSWISDRYEFKYFHLHVTLMLPTKFRVNWSLGSREEAKNRFSNGGHLGFLIWMILAIFLISKSPQCFLPSFESVGLSVQEKKRKIDFQDGHHWGHLGFPIGIILAIFDLQFTLMFLTKFRVNWPFSSEEEAKNRCSRWLPCRRPPWISDWNDFNYFFIYKSPRCLLPSFESIGLLVQEKKQKINFEDGSHGGHLGFPIGMILAIFDLHPDASN